MSNNLFVGRHVLDGTDCKIVGQVQLEFETGAVNVDLTPDEVEQLDALLQNGVTIASVVSSKAMRGFVAALGSGNPDFYQLVMLLLTGFEDAMDNAFTSVLETPYEMDMDSEPK